MKAVELEKEFSYLDMLSFKAEDFEKIAKKIRPKLMPIPGKDFKIYLKTRPPLQEGEKLIGYTQSACPECLALLNAVIFERDGKIWIRKVCPEHGEIEEVYWGDAKLYYRFSKWQYDGNGVENPHVNLYTACPFNCGLCLRHKSHPALVNFVATNRCDLSCWYCFFYAAKAGYVYEPTLEHVEYMAKVLASLKPVNVKAVQITGGEPTLRDDLVEIVKIFKKYGITHVQVNTTGIRFAYDPELAIKLRQAGTNVIYMSFDGVTPFTNPKNHWEVPYALESLRKAKMGLDLVPTVIKGYNDHELGQIIRFGLKHMDIVRGVNFQPISLTGRVPRKDREKLRITIPDAIIKIEEQTNGEISRDDWYPVPSVAPISHFVEALTGKPQFTLTTHFACGAATYIFKDGDKIIPITRFIQVDEFFNYLEEKAKEIREGKSKKLVLLELGLKLRKFIDWKYVPSSLKGKKLLNLLYNIFIKHDYSSLGEFHYKTLFLGMMHFQDLYNHDVARVQRCDIHYIMPDGRLVPFCSFNVIPELYRDRAQMFYGIPLQEWLKLQGKKLIEYKYKRNIKKLISGEVYRKAYEGIIDVDSIPLEKHIEASKRFGIPVIE